MKFFKKYSPLKFIKMEKKETNKFLNLILPGNPRYQPKELIEIFGYDNLYRAYIEVEIAAIKTLFTFGIMPKNDFESINANAMIALDNITTSQVDAWERAVTKHDIRALVQIIQKIFGPKAGRWVHIPLTSYDVIDTARALQFYRAFQVIKEKIIKVLSSLVEKIRETASFVQVGRTHGQHALPITVGFWLANIADRIFYNFLEMERYATGLVGKISGAVGAYNAQVGLGITQGKKDFEAAVLEKLGLKPAPISTQIIPPEPLSYFLFSCAMMSASFGQFGRDCRHLMRSEIGEVTEYFSTNQVGSSTMAHKRNPISFENVEGMWLRTKNEFGKVLDTLISEHQRDLVGSCVARDLPIIVVNLQQQLNTLLRPDGHGGTFLSNITIDTERCRQNLDKSAGLMIAEPLYLSLQMAGYEKDAHHLVNHRLLNHAKKNKVSLYQSLLAHLDDDEELKEVVALIPLETKRLFQEPEKYTGLASEKALEIADKISNLLKPKAI